MIKRIAAIAAGILAIGMLSFVASIPAAHAKAAVTCSSGTFYFQNINDSSLYLLDAGHNTILTQETEPSLWCLVDSGTNNWYEFVDPQTGLCAEVATAENIYMESCNDSSPEQWNQSIPGPHRWENRHDGNYMTGLCSASSTIDAYPSVSCSSGSPNYNQQWATPSE